jgi:hypothetical protein
VDRDRRFWIGMALVGALALGAGWMFRHAYVVARGEVFCVNRWTGGVERLEQGQVWRTIE